MVTARLLGFTAIGLADRNTVAGVVRAWQQAKVEGLSYHPGCRLVFCDGTPDMLAYPQDRKGWGHLCRMLTQANLRDESEKGAPRLYRDDLLEWGDLLSLAVLPDVTPRAHDGLGLLHRLKDRFGGGPAAGGCAGLWRRRPLQDRTGGGLGQSFGSAADGHQRRSLPHGRKAPACRTC